LVDPSKQTVPVSFGNAMVCADVAREVSVVRLLVVPVMPRLPLLNITNFVAPDLEAVKRSPVPELSTTSPATVVAPAIEAVGAPLVVFCTSSVARGVAVPTPNLLLTLSKYRFGSETMS